MRYSEEDSFTTGLNEGHSWLWQNLDCLDALRRGRPRLRIILTSCTREVRLVELEQAGIDPTEGFHSEAVAPHVQLNRLSDLVGDHLDTLGEACLIHWVIEQESFELLRVERIVVLVAERAPSLVVQKDADFERFRAGVVRDENATGCQPLEDWIRLP